MTVIHNVALDSSTLLLKRIVSRYCFVRPCLTLADGLYVLLRPQKKNKNSIDKPEIPPHLQDLLIKDPLPETCPWSLSGPQFPAPTAIQQRYCYPKGKAEYSNHKGGALWTFCTFRVSPATPWSTMILYSTLLRV